MLAIFEPITSPREISAAFCVIEEMATEVSGREVPIAIKVAPIIKGEIFIFPANFSMKRKRRLAEMMRKSRDIGNVRNSYLMAGNFKYTGFIKCAAIFYQIFHRLFTQNCFVPKLTIWNLF